MYPARSKVSTVAKPPVCAIVPMRGGSEPTIAPTKVFQGELYFIGRYMHRYENHTAFDITHVYGAN